MRPIYIIVTLMLVLVSAQPFGVMAQVEDDEISISIFHPRLGSPLILQEGDPFSVIVEIVSVSETPLNDGWGIAAVSADHLAFRWEQDAEDAIMGENGLELAFKVPQDAVDGLYDIEVTNGRIPELITSERHCLCVKDDISSEFKMVHLTDIHIGDLRGAAVDIQQTVGWKAAQKALEEINLLRPDMVLLTGDLVFGDAYDYEYSVCRELLLSLRVPLFCIPGNHDGHYHLSGEDGFDHWVDHFGPLYQSFEYGSSAFVCLNSFDRPAEERRSVGVAIPDWGGQVMDEQLDWLESELERLEGMATNVAMHHPLETFTGSGADRLRELFKRYGVENTFTGHTHQDAIISENGTRHITTTSCASSVVEYWGYRELVFDSGELVSYNYKEPRFSLPSYHLNITEPYGNHNENVEEMGITNGWNRDLSLVYDFYATGDLAWYSKDCEIIGSLSNGVLTRFRVSVDIPAEGSIVFGLAEGSYVLIEDQNEAQVVKLDDEGNTIETLNGVYLEKRTDAVDSVRLYFRSDRTILMERVEIVVHVMDVQRALFIPEGNDPSEVELNYSQIGGRINISDVRLQEGMNTIILSLNSDGNDPDGTKQTNPDNNADDGDDGYERDNPDENESIWRKPDNENISGVKVLMLIVLAVIFSLAAFFLTWKRR